jgi:hypothetical protein
MSADPWAVRHYRCRCPAELAGTATAREPDRGAMAVSPQRGIAAERHRALRLLAGAPLGATEAIMLAHGFTDVMLDALMRDGLATAEQRAMKAGRRPIQVTWFAITDAGRQALLGDTGPHRPAPGSRQGRPGRADQASGIFLPAGSRAHQWAASGYSVTP